MNDSDIIPSDIPLDSAARAHRRVSGESLGDKEIAILLRLGSGKMLQLLSLRLEPYGLSSSGYIGMMMLLGCNKESLNPSELAAMIGERRANMTRICDELVGHGLVVRRTDPDDRRRVNLSLSDQGLQLLATIQPQSKNEIEKVFAIFAPEEKHQLISMLSRLNHHLDSMI